MKVYQDEINIIAAMQKATSSQDEIFKDLPKYHENCKTEEETELHLARAALRLKERYSQVPFTRNERTGAEYATGSVWRTRQWTLKPILSFARI